MRLRTRLMIALLPLAVVPLAIVLPVAQANLRRTLSRELEGRLEAAHAAAAAALDKRAEEIRRSMDELADSAALEEVARALHGGAPPARVTGQATRLMSARGLTVLSLFDAQGITVSSGHVPARVGDPDPRLFAVSRREDPAPSWAMVERRDASGVREVPSLVAARAVDYGRVRVWAVGGAYLDAALARHLAGLTGTRVELLWAGQPLESAGSAAPPLLSRVLQLGDGVGVRLSISGAAQREAEAGITRAFLGLAVVGVLLTLLLGFYVARRISRSVEALTAGAQRVASGDLDAKVTARASGEVGELIGAFNQMTQQLRTQTEQLVASERIAAWQDVARRLAHELKNPLTPIKMSLETLLAARELNSPRFGELFGESATVILEEVERLRRTIDEFSRFARLPKPQLEVVALEGLLGQVLALYAAPRAGVTVVPQLQPGVTVRADHDQLTQVLLNLIKNADEAIPESGTIWVRVMTRSGQALIEVEDTGPGIPPEDRARVLEPYFTQKEGGTGLGLAIAARICQEHGGALEVDGAIGKGALMRVVLPLWEAVSP
ncbi:MAG: ATP-binding protein [Myxococcota bacterium]|nr:ATP-binding protein [Myxococcota bacterium]